ncbi:Mitotic interactor and substrate of PLK1 [Dissostichus eleginoides]|uniref:Mitotic interactor and substrate of PLK1 n=1 Tax=Dissostichus eleginoides TaxID=100907 RepID=A0AAD9BML1_DISEL|nr:Mitotic interactor and substrate of PLK1 [Dissostichus eleginoides]
MESDSYDDSQSDSGVSADFSPCSTLEGNTTNSPAAAPKETPIEREIRRAIEREHSLRRSRGLPNPPTAPEYVEIPLRKTVLCQSIPLNSERCQGKDRQFAGKKMQQEIHEETQREQDLVKLGTVPGFYDKGTAMSWSSVSDISTLEDQEDISSQASTIRGSHVERIHTQSQNLAKGGGTPRGAGYSEGKGCQVIILENNLSVPALKLYHAKPEAQPVTVVDSGRSNFTSSRTGGHDGIQVREPEKEEVEDEGAPKENPFFKLRSSTNLVKVEKDIREAQEREKELHKQRISLYGGTEGPKGAGRSGGPRGNETHGSTPVSWQVRHVAPPQSEEEKINRPEVLQGSLTPRQKTSLVQRWESGLVNGHNTEDD